MDTLSILPFLYERLILFILVFTRISTLLLTFSLFRRGMIIGRIVIVLSSILSFYVLVLHNYQIPNENVFSSHIFANAILQVVLGFIGALILNVIFEVFLWMGQIISTQIGMSLANLFDPQFGTVATLSQFYMLSCSLLFLFLNGHLFIIQTMLSSFDVFPPLELFIPKQMMFDVLKYSVVIFSGAVSLSITIIIVMLLTNIALAVMSKYAPQFNLFSIGINMELIIGLICLYLTFYAFTVKGETIIQDGLLFFQRLF